MSDCNSRYLTADGRILACTWGAAVCKGHHGVEGAGPYHDYVWPDSDPCSWDATCWQCDGAGFEFGNDGGYDGDIPDCTRCNTEGAVEQVPDRLIGIGSVWRSAVDGSVTVQDEWDTALSMHAEGWTLVRPVPPAHQPAKVNSHRARTPAAKPPPPPPPRADDATEVIWRGP